MKYQYLSETVAIRKIFEDKQKGVFEVEGLYNGYGLTVGNTLRRTLLSSLPGSAITQVKIKNVSHEFSTLPGMVEDVVELTLNLKKIRIKSFSDEPQVLVLKVKGEKEVTAKDIKLNSEVEIVNPEAHIATLTEKNAELDMEITVEKGLGYSPVDSRKMEKLGVGVIALDALFSPVTAVNYTVSDMRVGERTDYNKIKLEIATDGTISPSAALHKAANILRDHFEKISKVEVVEFGETPKVSEKTAKPKRAKQKPK